MTEFNRDGSNNSAPAKPQSGLRDNLIAQYGPHVGAALAEIEIASRRKNAERLQGLRTQLAALNGEIESKLRAHAEGLVPFQKAMDAAYAVWFDACNAYEAERTRGDGSVVELRAQATALIQEITRPPAHFQNMVRNWSRPADYSGPEEPREFENKTMVQVRPNWAPSDPNHAPPPREFYNVPQKGPGRG